MIAQPVSVGLTRSDRRHSVVVADQSPLVRDALVRLFSGDLRFRLHAAVGDGESLLDAVDQAHVDLGVIGWSLPTSMDAAS
jgi:DNA-binding NarL/FixJ family response regulator